MSAAYERLKLALRYDIIISKQHLNKNKLHTITRPTYVIVKHKDTWRLFDYVPKKKQDEIDINMITGLQEVLNHLSRV